MNQIISNFQNKTNSVTMFVYLINIILIALFFNNPLISGVILVSLFILSILTKREKIGSYLKFASVIFIITVLFNLILNQRGTQVLCSIPGLVVTSESLLNAVILGISFVNLLWAFFLYDAFVRTRVIFEVLSNIFKSIAIIFILTIKFIPQIISIFQETRNLQKFRRNLVSDRTKYLKRIHTTIDLTEIVLNKAMASFMNVSDTLILKGYEQRQKQRNKTSYHRIDWLVLLLVLASLIFNLSMLALKVAVINFGSADLRIPVNHQVIGIGLINSGIILLPVWIGGINYLWWKFYISKTTASATITAKNYR